MDINKHIRVHVFNTGVWPDLSHMFNDMFGVLPLSRIAVKCVEPNCRAVRLDDYRWKFIAPQDVEHVIHKPAVPCPEHIPTLKVNR